MILSSGPQFGLWSGPESRLTICTAADNVRPAVTVSAAAMKCAFACISAAEGDQPEHHSRQTVQAPGHPRSMVDVPCGTANTRPVTSCPECHSPLRPVCMTRFRRGVVKESSSHGCRSHVR
eukprot:823162-Rhodomonas_salina.1